MVTAVVPITNNLTSRVQSSGDTAPNMRAVIPDHFVAVRRILVSKVAPPTMICREAIGEVVSPYKKVSQICFALEGS